MNADPQTARVLDYHPPSSRRRRVLWWIVAVVGLFSIALAMTIGILRFHRYRQRLATQAAFAAAMRQQQLAYQQRVAELKAALDACRTYEAPADQVICDPKLDRAQLLLKQEGYQQIIYNQGAAFTPKCWDDIRHSVQYPDADAAGKWILSPAGIAFLHEREVKDRTPALVRVSAAMITKNALVLNPLVIRELNKMAIAPAELGIMLAEDDDFRLLAGQADATDASHFTIPYEINGTPGAIDGRLRADDAIEFRPREGQVLPGDQFAVWQPPGSKAKPATSEAALKWPRK